MGLRQKTIKFPASGKPSVVSEADGSAIDILYPGGDLDLNAYPDYWAYLTVSIGDKTDVNREDILDLWLPDRDFLAIEIHRLTYDDKLKLRQPCPSHGDATLHVVDLGKLDLIPLPEGVDPNDPTFTIKLAGCGSTVIYGYQKARDDQIDSGTGLVEANFSVIRSIDGSEKFSMQTLRDWPASDHRALHLARWKNRCGYDTRVRFTCGQPGCSMRIQQNLITDPAFFAAAIPSLD